MCGIVSIFNIKEQTKPLRDKALAMAKKIRHRGPDWSGIYCGRTAILAHERLSIVDPQSGKQPLFSPDHKQILAVNGEIYNHLDIRKRYAGKYQFQTGSDCEVILALYRDKGIHFLEELNGIFAFALYDEEQDTFLIARDPIGVIPLYIGYDADGKVYCASELKALEGFCDRYEPFLPGHYYDSKEGKMTRWYTRDWMSYDAVKDNPASVEELREALEAAVRRQLMSDVPYGVLLSGGLDSSVISAVAKKYASHRVESNGKQEAWWPQLHSFAVGLKGAPDLAKAREVADHIGTVHHEINYTIQEGLDAVRDVIYFIETYDVTTVRASTPMYLLARVIKSMGIKMVLSGEGADEVFGGYLYFHKAPDARAFHEETLRKLSKLYLYDCLRANKSLAAWGVEGRVPFLDKEFLDVAMRLNPAAKMCPGKTIEKENRARGISGYAPGRSGMAPERAVQRRGGLQLDRYAESRHFASRKRRTDGTCRRAFPRQHPDEQGRVLLPQHLRGIFPQRECRPKRAQRAQRGLLHRRGACLGRGFQEHERAERTRRSRGARGGIRQKLTRRTEEK